MGCWGKMLKFAVNIHKIMSERKLKIGITHGDTNGVGYEVIIKALENPAMTDLFTPVIYGSAKAAAYYAKTAKLTPLNLTQIADAAQAKGDHINIINVVDESLKIEPGQESEEAGKAAFAALERAVTDLRSGAIDALVTAPINKHSIQSDHFPFPGHTEYLESSLGDGEKHALMILCNDTVRVALVTIHEPISKVATMVTRENVLRKIEEFNASLTRDFGIGHPRIAVLALNPHSGEEGMIGTEEQQEITPAIEEARGKKINCFGPYAADGFWGSGMFGKFDGVLAHVPRSGPCPVQDPCHERRSQFHRRTRLRAHIADHGTGYDIAGSGKASEESFRQAIYTAIDVVRNRRRHEEATRNPLKKHYVEKNKKDNVVLDLTKSDD